MPARMDETVVSQGDGDPSIGSESSEDDPQDAADDRWTVDLPPLVRAAWLGDRDEVNRLLTTSISVHQAEDDGWTALHAAAVRGHADVVALLAAGARADVFFNGESVASRASKHGHRDVAARLRQAAGAGGTVGPP